MWENTVRRRFIRNIIFAILCVAALVGLFYVIRQADAKRAEQVANLTEVSAQKKAEQEESKNGTLISLQNQYEKDMDSVAEYLPGIVCWGDTLTRGTSGNVSYPEVLRRCITENLSDKYDLTASLVGGGVVYTGIDSDNYKLDIPVINMGGGNESTATVLARAGVSSFVLSKSVTIPAQRESVRIYISSSDGSEVSPLTVGEQGLNPVSIGGVIGTINLVSNGKAHYTFTRLEEGEACVLEKGTKIECSNVYAYSDYVHVIWLGSYDSSYSVPEYLERCETLLSRQTKNTERFIVVGPCSYRQRWDGSTAKYMLDLIDSAMLARYGDQYICLRKYLMTDGPKDAGLSLTSADQKTVAEGAVPGCFRSGDDSPELSADAYELLGRLIYDRMDRLGYFNEIVEELEIGKIEAIQQ